MSCVSSSILFYGPSGSGKTTIGRLFAQQLNLPFHDLDLEIEAQQGRKIAEIFAGQGEAAFRAMECAALQAALGEGGVISLGGGALTYPATRAAAEGQGRVLLLKAEAETILARLQADSSNPRPLLEGDARAKLQAMLLRRQAHYAEFPRQLDTTHLSPAEAAWQAQVLLGMFRVAGMGQPYDVRVQAGALDDLGAALKLRRLGGPTALIADEASGRLYAARAAESLRAAGYAVQIVTIPSGEQFKTMETVQQIWGGLLAGRIERGSTVIALGGGVVGDLTGFAAAMWLRGVRWVNLPTTLLAMCDSSLGGKTGADLPQGKNLVGAFHPPALVLADPQTLATLPAVELRNGMAEVLKHGVIADPALFDLCQQMALRDDGSADLHWLDEIVRRSMAVKVGVIEEDPYEKGRRAALNLGHTIGHAVELVSGFRLRHGEAVAIGMTAEARLAEQMGLAAPQERLSTRIAQALQTIGLPTEIPPDLDSEAIRRAMSLDKKRAGGKVKFALPIKIGEVVTGVEHEN